MRSAAAWLYRVVPFKGPVFDVVRRLVRLPEPLFRHLSFQGVIEVPVEDCSFQMFHHGTQIENEVFWSGLYGRWEGESLRVWVRACRHAGAILDVGAHSGLYALAAKAVAPKASVAAVEPLARIRGKLERNVALNGFRITIVAAAASDRDASGWIMDPGDEHALSASVDPEGTILAGHAFRPVRTPLVRIDTLVDEGTIPPPELVKLDVEGHEAAVLHGMDRQLRERRPVLAIEVLTPRAARAVADVVDPLDYLVYRLGPEGPRRLPAVAAGQGANLLLCASEDARRLGLGG